VLERSLVRNPFKENCMKIYRKKIKVSQVTNPPRLFWIPSNKLVKQYYLNSERVVDIPTRGWYTTVTVQSILDEVNNEGQVNTGI